MAREEALVKEPPPAEGSKTPAEEFPRKPDFALPGETTSAQPDIKVPSGEPLPGGEPVPFRTPSPRVG